MSVAWAILAALGLGVIANNLYDVMPWLAHRLLRHTAKLEAETPDEAPLIYAESVAVLDEVPGKLTQLLFAVGRLTHARHLQWRQRHPKGSSRIKGWLVSVVAFVIVTLQDQPKPDRTDYSGPGGGFFWR